jgi:hypothetical protein
LRFLAFFSNLTSSLTCLSVCKQKWIKPVRKIAFAVSNKYAQRCPIVAHDANQRNQTVLLLYPSTRQQRMSYSQLSSIAKASLD